jgi:hypothetical protein
MRFLTFYNTGIPSLGTTVMIVTVLNAVLLQGIYQSLISNLSFE